jgi:hypothetical protein
MKERPLQVVPKSSEDDPPAANQPSGGGDLGEKSNAKSGSNKPSAGGANEPVPAKPDGEVDTRA